MTKQSRKPRDLNALAHAIVAESTSETRPEPESAAVIHGRLGGFIGGAHGGRVRAARLTPERRREIAQKAAAARWGKAKTDN